MALGLRLGLGHRRAVSDNGIPPIVSDGNTSKWFDYLQNVTKDGSDRMSIWDNVSGIPGIIPGGLLQATPADQPLWSANDVLLDGVSESMKCAAFTLVQPTMIYIVFKQITWVVSDTIFDGNGASTGRLMQKAISPDFIAKTTLESSPASGLTLGSYGIVRVLFNGASSKLTVNNETPVTGDFGSTNMGGFTLGALGSIARWTNIGVKEIMIRKIVDTEANDTAIYNFLKNKSSL